MLKKGFTLLEILMVFVLIGLSISIVIPNIGNTYDKIKFRSETKKVYELIQKIKFHAFYYQKNISISEEENHLLIEGFDISTEEIPKLQYEVEDEIHFSPNGISSGGEILIYFKGKPKTLVKIKKFSGNIKLESI